MITLKNNQGQGLLEFAIVILLLFMVIYGALVIGQIFHAKVVLNNAAREGVRYLSLHPADNIGSFSGTKAAAVLEATNSGVVLDASNVTVPDCIEDDFSGFCESGSPVLVMVGTTFNLAWDWLFPSTITIQGEARMMVP
ncbi:MAG: pilus assembly protein [Chloroflexi bacterium]|nr:pilus assembly protein [Chloroflexota bacterium]